MELTVKVDDKEGPFVIELLKKFSFVQEVKASEQTVLLAWIDRLWQSQAKKLFASQSDFNNWLTMPNSVIQDHTPISLLNDEAGYQTVSKLLGRLEHGIMA